MFSFEKATEEHIGYVATNIDKQSAKAIEICGVTDIQAEMLKLLDTSTHTVCVAVNGLPIAVFGVIETKFGVGSVWLVKTEGLKHVPVRLLIQARRFIQAFLQQFPRLRTIVWEENTSHVKWVEWLGFNKIDKVPYGNNGELFHVFILET